MSNSDPPDEELPEEELLDEDLSDEEPAAAEIQTAGRQHRKALRRLNRELDDKELRAPGVQKLLMDDMERLERELDEAKQYRNQFHNVDKRFAVLDEKNKHNLIVEITHSGCLTLAGAAFGFIPFAWSHDPFGPVTLVAACALFVLGIFAKVGKR